MSRINSAYISGSRDIYSQLATISDSKINKKRSSEIASQNILINKIEKHIDDVKKSNFNSSKDVGSLLGKLSSNASDILAQTNPELLNKYSGYLSAFRYDRAARFVSGVEYGLSTMADIKA